MPSTGVFYLPRRGCRRGLRSARARRDLLNGFRQSCGIRIAAAFSDVRVFQISDAARKFVKFGHLLRVEVAVQRRAGIEIAFFEHEVDHTLQTQLAAVFRRKNAGDAVLVQFANLFGNDDSTAAAEDAEYASRRVRSANRAGT